MPVDRLEEGLRRGHADVVAGHIVVGLVAADADVGARRADQLLDLRQDQAGVDRGRRRGDAVGQSLALLDVEDGEALEERDCPRFLAPLMGAVAHVVRDEAVGIDDGGPALALADVAAERQGLLEGQPALGGEALLDDGVPQDEDVDAAVGPAGGGVLRHSERCAHARRAPRLHPGQAAGLQLGDDLVGDLLVERAAIFGWARASSGPWMRTEPWLISMTGRPRASLSASRARHGDSRPALPLRAGPDAVAVECAGECRVREDVADWTVCLRGRRNERIVVVVPRQGPSPEWAETRRLCRSRAASERPGGARARGLLQAAR